MASYQATPGDPFASESFRDLRPAFNMDDERNQKVLKLLDDCPYIKDLVKHVRLAVFDEILEHSVLRRDEDRRRENPSESLEMESLYVCDKCFVNSIAKFYQDQGLTIFTEDHLNAVREWCQKMGPTDQDLETWMDDDNRNGDGIRRRDPERLKAQVETWRGYPNYCQRCHNRLAERVQPARLDDEKDENPKVIKEPLVRNTRLTFTDLLLTISSAP